VGSQEAGNRDGALNLGWPLPIVSQSRRGCGLHAETSFDFEKLGQDAPRTVPKSGQRLGPPSARRPKALGRRVGSHTAPAGPLHRLAKAWFLHTFSALAGKQAASALKFSGKRVRPRALCLLTLYAACPKIFLYSGALPKPDSGRTKSCRRSARAGWARCIGRGTRS
jgi:hypothetical protein